MAKTWFELIFTGSAWNIALTVNATSVATTLKQIVATALKLDSRQVEIIAIKAGSLVATVQLNQFVAIALSASTINSVLQSTNLAPLQHVYTVLSHGSDAVVLSSIAQVATLSTQSTCGGFCIGMIVLGLMLLAVAVGITVAVVKKRRNNALHEPVGKVNFPPTNPAVAI
jgi:hypothetical protein